MPKRPASTVVVVYIYIWYKPVSATVGLLVEKTLTQPELPPGNEQFEGSQE